MGIRVGQSANKTFKRHRKGVARILNEKRITMTVEGHHEARDGLYDKFEGDAYELAKIHTGGLYGVPKRPFMRVIKDIFKTDEEIKKLIQRNMRYDKSERGWLVNYRSVCLGMERRAQEHMTTGFVQAQLPPLQADTVYKRNKAGYNSPLSLYASGQLVDCIVARAT